MAVIRTYTFANWHFDFLVNLNSVDVTRNIVEAFISRRRRPGDRCIRPSQWSTQQKTATSQHAISEHEFMVIGHFAHWLLLHF